MNPEPWQAVAFGDRFGIQLNGSGWVANPCDSFEAAQREAARMNAASRVYAARRRLADLIESHHDRVPIDEVFESLDTGTVEALEQLAAQYGLLKPGTQGAM